MSLSICIYYYIYFDLSTISFYSNKAAAGTIGSITSIWVLLQGGEDP